jgi:ABC-type polysaccharide/polyol phosphate export permease
VKYIVQVLITFGVFFVPIFFEPAMFGSTGAQLMMLNPLSPLLEGIRLSLVDGHNLLVALSSVSTDGQIILVWSPWYLAYGVFWAIIGFLGSSLLFRRLAFLFAEYI